LHVLITVEDSNNRANVKIQRAVEEIKKLLIPITDGEDELKKRQLMELAIINGTYRDSSQRNSIDAETFHKTFSSIPVTLTTPIRTTQGTPLGAPLIISSRQFSVPTSAAHLINGSGPPPLITPADAGLLYTPYDFHSQYLTSPTALLAEYPTTASLDSLCNSGGLFGR
jgi:protein quaking